MNAPQHIVVQRSVSAAGVPAAPTLRHWASRALAGRAAEVTLRIVDENEMTALNDRFRKQPRPTNVLSFGYDNTLPGGLAESTPPPLGDLVICKAVVLREAREQGIAARAHWAHMVVHGILHLRGMDHVEDEQAIRMEIQERQILAELGFDDPYRSERPRATPVEASTETHRG